MTRKQLQTKSSVANYFLNPDFYENLGYLLSKFWGNQANMAKSKSKFKILGEFWLTETACNCTTSNQAT